MKIACKQANVCIKSNNPKFKYRFKKAGDPVEVEEEHVEKILMNGDFYESDKPIPQVPEKEKEEVPEKTWEEELIEINGVGKKTCKDIQTVFPKKSDLLEALEKEKPMPFDDDISEKLKEVFIH